jgi:hypothetical protein
MAYEPSPAAGATRLELLGVPLRLQASQPLLDRLNQEFRDLFGAASGAGTSPEQAQAREQIPEQVLQLTEDVPGDQAQYALTELSAFVLDHSPMLCIHAGVVSGANGVLALPGVSGLGKTTLVAALVGAGYGYLSDEALALDRTSGVVTAFPRPLAINSDVWDMLGLPADAKPLPGAESLVQPDQLGQIAATAAGGARVTDIVLVTREPGAPSLQPERRGEAVSALLGRSFNHYRDGEASFRNVVRLARDARVWRGHYENAPDFAELMTSRIPAPQTDSATTAR